MKDYSEYVQNKYNEWTDKYNIPEHMEFELKTMFELEEQFRNQPQENVKTKSTILDMIMRIKGRFNGKLFEKKQCLVFLLKFCGKDMFLEIINYDSGEIVCNKFFKDKSEESFQETIKSLIKYQPRKIIFNDSHRDDCVKFLMAVRLNPFFQIDIDQNGNITYNK